MSDIKDSSQKEKDEPLINQENKNNLETSEKTKKIILLTLIPSLILMMIM